MPSEQDDPGYDSLNPHALWHDVGKAIKQENQSILLKFIFCKNKYEFH